MSAHFQDDRLHVRTNVFGMVRRLWPYFMRHKLLFFASLVAVFVVAIAARLAVTLFGYAIDNGINKNDRSVITFVAIAYFVLEGGRCFMSFLQGYLFAKVGNRILYEIRDELMGHVQSLPISYFDKNPTGRIVTRVTTDVISLGEMFTQGLINIFAAFVSMIAILGAMAQISVKLTLITMLIAPPLMWIVKRLSARLMEVLRESKTKIAALNAFVAENISGMRVLQLYGRIGRNSKRFHVLSKDYREQQMQSVQLYAMLWPTVSFFNAASVGAALYFGGRFVIAGEVTTGAMVAFILHVRAFIDPLHQILEKYQNLQNSQSGAERIFTLLEETPEELLVASRAPLATEHVGTSATAGGPSSAHAPMKFAGEIRFENLGFRYGDHLPFALEGVTLDVKPGESVALVGRTGSGKSTLISLLQRFYDPSAGRLFIDGREITSIPKRELRARIGVVQQDTFLFRGTIAENVSLGDPRVSRARIEEAARLACLMDVIGRREKGLDAKVEERGANLSVGERQLIAFARILAFDPDILILDEATANIDSRTENLIQEATRRVRSGRTSFIIAHRISTVLDCDKIVVLDRAKVKEIGTHGELIAQNGIYNALYQAQTKAPAATI